MKYSYKWLKELTNTSLSAKELGERIMMHAFEVEGMSRQDASLENVVVGEILEIAKHPNADRLQVVQVDAGKFSFWGSEQKRRDSLTVVCGAHNIAVGDKVPLALVGAKLPGGLEIKEAEIRGVRSFGMLCAKDELGLGEDHSGIMILDRKAKVGESLAKQLGLEDIVLEIDVLANRAHDALSHVGMAREIAAIEGTKMEYAYDEIKPLSQKSKKIKVSVAKNAKTPFYSCALIEGVKVGPSPDWLVRRLRACGIKPINNVVDATNYVMLELGNPLHAFDADKLSGGIMVRLAKEGERISLLDGVDAALCAGEDIVIADSKGAIALAGIMGGVESAVSDRTENIVLEAATFDGATIRRSRMRSGFATDAALRFEKGISPSIAEKALVRCVEIITHTAGGKLEGVAMEKLKKEKTPLLSLEMEKAQKLLGIVLKEKEAKRILSSLGFVVMSGGAKLKVQVPAFRLDVVSAEDLIEEIGRIAGYDKIGPAAPLVSVASPQVNERRVFVRKAKHWAAGEKFSEVYNYAFYGPKEANMGGLEGVAHVEIENPQSPELSLMRASLVPNMLKAIRENLKYRRQIRAFEEGRVYRYNAQGEIEEKEMLLLALSGDIPEESFPAADVRSGQIFFAIKHSCGALLEAAGIKDWYLSDLDGAPAGQWKSFWRKGRSAEIRVEGMDEPLGYCGEVNPFVAAAADIPEGLALCELEIDKWREAAARQKREYEEAPKFPYVRRDLSLEVRGSLKAAELEKIIKQSDPLVREVELFDTFVSKDGTVSYALHITLGSKERTLSGQEAEVALEKIIAQMEKELPVALRK
ncbi:MAG TPA: phenylalanine--tRNA ligase subunit beta [Candidatus Moranbacteria bacterium]|nr:phenylalanine--tRNA ligase subunit beta [Candidatus Moranbacteria bacterium]